MFINPIIFYLIGLCDRVNWVLIIIAILAFIFVALCFGIMLDAVYDKDLPKYRAIFKKSVIVFVISILGIVFTPSTETATKMLIASQITQETQERPPSQNRIKKEPKRTYTHRENSQYQTILT